MADPKFYARPEGDPRPLEMPPRLVGWLVTGNPDPVHVREFVTSAEQALGPPPMVGGPLALRLDVGLPGDARLLDQYGLARYLGPLVEWLGAHGRDFTSVWATKAAAADSVLRVGPARPVPLPAGERRFAVRTDTSAGSPAFTAQVGEQLAGAQALPAGPVQLQLSYTVPPGSNWAALWQPTVAGLTSLLGATADDRPDEPADGRVVELALHRREDPFVGHATEVTGVVRRLS
ncbi:hypothetical protein DQ238_03070 [Geodermatophilus sp. TF02-6]|uniref:hypothetical protein n=1 Tax=Geodermatophilus sp. TF02-6 TaxID=2250575 RepID=UPI000DEB5A35|nr:hypothetical protein [Geodermatophilus sp. TF02-6]RBY82989.1 hypothetical protein DQ238_03070 [Geodermatophilus sp. TF02-6]